MIDEPPTDPDEIARIGEDVPLLDGIRTTRAIRRFRPEPVAASLIRKVCEAGTFAPSGGNRQPWRFIAVTALDRRAWVAERYRRAFAAYIAPALRAAEAKDFSASKRRNIHAAVDMAEHLHEIPVHLFVAAWKRGGGEQPQSVYPAIQNILLACRAVGLGACLTTAHLAYRDEIDAFLGLPEGVVSSALLPIGWPRDEYARPPRRSVDECLHFERYCG